jgi:hypothetical protein
MCACIYALSAAYHFLSVLLILSSRQVVQSQYFGQIFLGCKLLNLVHKMDYGIATGFLSMQHILYTVYILTSLL